MRLTIPLILTFFKIFVHFLKCYFAMFFIHFRKRFFNSIDKFYFFIMFLSHCHCAKYISPVSSSIMYVFCSFGIAIKA